MSTNILVSSVGRRSQLIDCLQQSLKALDLDAKVLGVDCSTNAPGAYLVDEFIKVPRCTDPGFIPAVLEICKQNQVLLLIPTIDTELATFAEHRQEFADIGATIAISSPETIRISADKVVTHAWLVENGFPTVRQATSEAFLQDGAGWSFPLIVKPRRGSASQGVVKVSSRDLLRELCKNRDDMIVQELAVGREYTVNVLVNKQGRCVCAVPHLRVEVRAGEVSKGITCRHKPLMDLASKIAERLPGAYGPLNIQTFLAPDGSLRVTEINARFGGGYPLAQRAGANFPKWILEELLCLPSTSSEEQWEDGLTMLRYDDAVFISRKDVSNEPHA